MSKLGLNWLRCAYRVKKEKKIRRECERGGGNVGGGEERNLGNLGEIISDGKT